MLQQPADVVARGLGQERVALGIVEEVRALLPQALVGVHPRAVVTEERLRHERDDLAVGRRRLPNDVLVLQDLVGGLDEGPVADVDLGLARAADLVVLDLDVDARRLEGHDHLGAEVLELVERRDREVALLGPRPVGEVRRPVAARVPDPFLGVDLVHSAVAGLVEPQRVEDVELDLGAPEARRGDAALGEEALGLATDVARVARIRLAAARLRDVAHEDHRRDVEGRVDEGGRRVRQEQHVALMDVLEAANARSVEADAVDEQVLTELLDRNREVLRLAGQVDEAEVDHEDATLTGERHDVGDGGRGRGNAARVRSRVVIRSRTSLGVLCITHEIAASSPPG